MMSDIFYSIKFNLINKLGLYVWVYGRDSKKYKKIKAYYKKLGKNPDELD